MLRAIISYEFPIDYLYTYTWDNCRCNRFESCWSVSAFNCMRCWFKHAFESRRCAALTKLCLVTKSRINDALDKWPCMDTLTNIVLSIGNLLLQHFRTSTDHLRSEDVGCCSSWVVWLEKWHKLRCTCSKPRYIFVYYIVCFQHYMGMVKLFDTLILF